MRLIDADKLHKALKETVNELFTKEDVSCFLYAESVVDMITTEKAIPISWLHKQLIDLMYDGIAKEDVLHVFHKVIAKWEKENENSNDLHE